MIKMNKKAISKFWMEIIMGAIVVAILLAIVLFFASGLTSGLEDSANTNNFNTFAQTMSKAFREGEETTTSWRLATGVDERVYAITYITQGTAAYLESQGVFKDELSKLNIAKCSTAAAQGKDICLCLVKLTYANSCDNIQYNMMYLDADDTNYATLEAKMGLFQDYLKYVFNNRNIVSEVKIKGCYLVKTELGCTWQQQHACQLYYNITNVGPRAVVWLSAQGGVVDDDPLSFEELILDRGNIGSEIGFAVFMKPYLDIGTPLNAGSDMLKCTQARHPCSNNCDFNIASPTSPINCSIQLLCSQVGVITPGCVITPCRWSG